MKGYNMKDYTDTYALFAANLRYLRKRYDLTPQTLADAIGISVDRIAVFESGTVFPDLDEMYALAQYFHVAADTLLEEDQRLFFRSLPRSISPDDLETQLIDLYLALSPHSRGRLMEAARSLYEEEQAKK